MEGLARYDQTQADFQQKPVDQYGMSQGFSEGASTTTKEPFGQEVTSDVTQAFGSPHIGSPAPPRSPIDAAAKQLDFGLGRQPVAENPASPVTPAITPADKYTPASPVPATPVPISSGFGSDVDYDTFVKDTLLWHNKVRSAVYLLGGLLLILGVNRLLNSRVSIVTGVCWLFLAQAALNFARAFVSPNLQERCTWADSAWTAGLANRISYIIHGAAALHDKHLNGKDANKTLRIVGVLWLVSMAGRVLSPTALAIVLWIAAFILPKAYVINKRQADQVVSDVSVQVKSRFMKLDPKARAAIVIVPIFAAGYALSSADLAVAVLAMALYGRSCMAPAQAERLNAVVAPAITNTVSKVGGTVSRLMTSAVNKYELTPTPVKKKMM